MRLALVLVMTSTITQGSFSSVIQDYRARAATGAKTHFVKEGGADAGTLKDTLRSLGFGQEKLSDAVRAFQEKHNADHPNAQIKVDGKAGGQTLEALYGTADAQRRMCGADTAKFLDAKAKMGPLSSAPTESSVRLRSSDPSATQAQLEQKLRQNQAARGAAPAAEANVGARAAEIASIREELAGLGELNARQPGYYRKQQLSDRLETLTADHPNASKVADLDARIEELGAPNPRQPAYHQKKKLEAERARLMAEPAVA